MSLTNTISIAIACTGLGIALGVFIYVKCCATKEIERKLKAKRLEILAKVEEENLGQSRVGIRPMKNKPTKQKSSLSTGSETSYFVSYFGMAFQPPKHKSAIIRAPEEGVIEDVENRRTFQSIAHEKHVNMHRIEETLTPPTDGESTPSEQSLMTGTMIKLVKSGSSTDSGLSNDSAKIKSSKIEDVLMDSGLSFDSNTNSTSKSHRKKFNEEDDDLDSLQLSNSDDNDVINDIKGKDGEIIRRDSDDSDSFKSFQKPDLFPYDEEVSTGSETDQNKKMSLTEESNNDNIHPQTLASVVQFMNDMNRGAILEQKHFNKDEVQFMSDINRGDIHEQKNSKKDEVVEEDIQNLVERYNNKLIRTENSYEGVGSNLENPSYFSSDDERSSTIGYSEYYGETDDDSRYSNEHQPQQRYMVQQIDSSLTMPDLAESGSDSGDWELSSSSEDRSEKPTEKKSRIVIKSIEENIQSAKDEEKDLITCVFCHVEFDAKEGVRFSFDERCKHLLCESCCEEGKAAQINGECPECHYRQNVPRIPRVGEQTQRHRPDSVIMSI